MYRIRYALIILILFFNISMSHPCKNGDVDCSGFIDIVDVTTLISYIFSHGSLSNCTEAYPKSIIILDTVISDTSLKIIEFIEIDTSSASLHNYNSAGDIYSHTFRVYRNNILCDSVKFMDIVHRMFVDRVTDTFPQGCDNLTNILLKSNSTSINLCWTIPGTKGKTTNAEEYEIRYADFVITPTTYDLTKKITGPNPSGTIAGTYQEYRVTGLSPNTKYYFVLKYRVGNIWSEYSNVAIKTTGE